MHRIVCLAVLLLSYNIYRRAGNGETQLASTWVWNQGLTPNSNGSYSYQDMGLTNGMVLSAKGPADRTARRVRSYGSLLNQVAVDIHTENRPRGFTSHIGALA